MEQPHWNEMVQRVHDYGEAHPAVVAGQRVEVGSPDQLVVLLWGSESVVAEHRRALSELIGPTDNLRFETARWSRSQIEAIRADIREMQERTPGAFRVWGPTEGRIRADLRADQEPLAATLHQRYGDAIVLTVGNWPYPPDRQLTALEERHRANRLLRNPAPAVPMEVDGLVTHLELLTPRVRPGEDGRGRVHLRNDGTSPIEVDTDSNLLGQVVDPTTGELLGGFSGFLAGTGWQISLGPGESQEMGMIFGTASSRPGPGYAIPPGEYLVQTRIPVYELPNEPDRPRRFIPVPPADLTIAIDQEPRA